jgi:hypothetical protein
LHFPTRPMSALGILKVARHSGQQRFSNIFESPPNAPSDFCTLLPDQKPKSIMNDLTISHSLPRLTSHDLLADLPFERTHLLSIHGQGTNA